MTFQQPVRVRKKIVQSTSLGGHTTPAAGNQCFTGVHSGKPNPSIACVEIMGGRNLIIREPAGQVNADTKNGHSWIDIFIRGDITIGSDFATGTPYRIHANKVGATNETGGDVTVYSIEGVFSSVGRAISANALGGGGRGGSVDVEAFGNVSLSTGLSPSSIQARGATSGGGPAGGTIFVRSWNGVVSGTPGSGNLGELNAGGGLAANLADDGSVTLQDCDLPASPGTAYTGNVIPAPAIILADACGGAPPLPAYITLPVCLCGCACIDLFTPVTGPAGTDVTINGKGLTFATEIRFSLTTNNCNPATGTVATFVGPKTDATIHVEVPALGAGSYNIIAICPTGSYCTSTPFVVQ